MTSLRLRHSGFWWLPILTAFWCFPSNQPSPPSLMKHILSNGMKVLLVEVPKAPVATVQVWYKVGSRNEVMGRAGSRTCSST